MGKKQKVKSNGDKRVSKYYPTKSVVATPRRLVSFEQIYGLDSKGTILPLQGSLYTLVTIYAGKASSLEKTNLAAGAKAILSYMVSNPTIHPTYSRRSVFRTAYRQKNINISIIHYCLPIPHIKGVAATYSVIVVEDVLTNITLQTYSSWNLEFAKSISEEEDLYHSSQQINLTDEKNPIQVFEDIVFSLTPYRPKEAA